jgi:hypothetical protein
MMGARRSPPSWPIDAIDYSRLIEKEQGRNGTGGALDVKALALCLTSRQLRLLTRA